MHLIFDQLSKVSLHIYFDINTVVPYAYHMIP